MSRRIWGDLGWSRRGKTVRVYGGELGLCCRAPGTSSYASAMSRAWHRSLFDGEEPQHQDSISHASTCKEVASNPGVKGSHHVRSPCATACSCAAAPPRLDRAQGALRQVAIALLRHWPLANTGQDIHITSTRRLRNPHTRDPRPKYHNFTTQHLHHHHWGLPLLADH
jgi:hypothetical protein